MKFYKCLIIILLSAQPVFAEPADKQSSKVDVNLYVSGGLGIVHFSDDFMKWPNDYSSNFLSKASASDSSFSGYNLRRKYSKNYDTENLKITGNIFFENFGFSISALIADYVYTDINGPVPKTDSTTNKSYDDSLRIWSATVSPSLLFRTNKTSFGDGIIYAVFGGGVDYVILHYKYQISGDFPPVGAKTKEFKDDSLGWHVSAGINYDYGLLGLFSELTYTHVHFDSIKEKNGSDVMRYSDGRKVSTSIDTVVLSVGAGLHIGW
jgi:hypothetical protein